MICCSACCCRNRTIERTFDLVKVEGRPYLTFADGMVPADLATCVRRLDDGSILVEYNAGGQPFDAIFRPYTRPE